jgi:AraC family transcriptional regulator, regulatory protein of adaptative response / DNA-3-methyladenine glycosylase II
VIDDHDRCYAAVRARDTRFDGWFTVGVHSTRIYCRPSCPAMTPRRDGVAFFATAAAAQRAGFRACKRCRPDAVPGSPAWDLRADLVARAMRLIADGVVDREGVEGLAARLGYSARHLHRQLVAEVGTGPLALARAQRARAARVLIETTALPFAQVAFAAGFASLRQFNDTVREVFALTPSQLRRRAGSATVGHAEAIVLRLPCRAPSDVGGTIRFLVARAAPGVETATADGGYARTLALPHGTATVELLPASDHARARLRLQDLRDLTAAVQRCRRMLDLDADPVAVAEHLRADAVLAPLVAAVPGRRVPGTADPAELALRALLGQQVSVAAARTLAGRLVAQTGSALPAGGADPAVPELTSLFPTPEAVAEADLCDVGLPPTRQAALLGLARALAEGAVRLDPGSDREEAEARLLALPGIGPWTAGYIRMRGLGDPDGFPAGDLALRRALAKCAPAVRLEGHAARWRPWRGYAAVHLWAATGGTGPRHEPAAPRPHAQSAQRRVRT